MNENDLMNKLAISKKIMERHSQTPRNTNGGGNMNFDTNVREFDVPQAKFNIPQEFMGVNESKQQIPQHTNTKDRILSSKLPDEIKRLMLEHPIQQPTMGMGTNAVLSNELIEKASRLMNTNAKGDVVNESRTRRQVQSQPTQPTSSLSTQEIKDIVRETMEEVLSENGLLVESESKSGEMFKFRVGQHLFEGKVLKVKKMAK